MKSLIKYTLAVTLAAGAAASPSHHHLHRHAKKNAGSKVEKRADIVIDIVATATETVYQLDGEVIVAAEAVAGLADGEYIIVGESTPTYSSPPLPTSISSQNAGAQFIESKTSSAPATSSSTISAQPSSTSSASSTSSNPPPSSSTAAQPKQSGSGSGSGSGSSSGSGATGLNAPFPSGQLKCSELPTQYGAVPMPWLGFDGWSGLQMAPGYSPGASSIITINTGIAGDACVPGTFCTYACPNPYQMAQWPSAQGSRGQSVGGLWCNSDGYLELTREGTDTLCQLGAGGVTIQNDLTEVVNACGTQYAGTENMVLNTTANPGQTIELLNPSSANSYTWKGKPTTNQYYLNMKGLTVEEACLWTSPTLPGGAGNWSPCVIGAGQDTNGITWLSIFENSPTSTAILDFNVEIIGDVSSDCSFINGQWTGGEAGCTVSLAVGGSATIRYF